MPWQPCPGSPFAVLLLLRMESREEKVAVLLGLDSPHLDSGMQLSYPLAV